MQILKTFFWHSIKNTRFFSKAACLCLLIFFATGAFAQSIQEQIIGTSQAFLEQITAEYLADNTITGRHRVKIGRLDSRLRLPVCAIPLQVSLESPAQPIGRVTLRVRCDSNAPWTIFVPGQVDLYREVAVSLRSLARNSVVQAADVQLAERDVSSLRQGYILNLENVIGQKLTRPIQPNQVISANFLKAAAAVNKGDAVVISARGSSMFVRMPGIALEEGAIGQQIKVRNARSQRTVHARVTAPGQVEVAM
ncbi:flagellar basal body P-ring formation chaperone FlgA [Denitrificimonas caeni]|uniref:Flagella basal body P-ring formation protein FlgA n=1 Tax=Denitrificimonas caeni TaxID=521720 RepID=A0AAE9VP97_9GAMM|nr:flagellar basal body P-ring formation chaperone FlgA [Denitrificimonas caeni]NLJ12520.1 flagellar basal body P-ring formation protein FlgA [Gammaproteobacteria bacterium]WBE24948.1 flagellar basal body P-ring formation chaperone FlgA [Denitrificimonas caeni]